MRLTGRMLPVGMLAGVMTLVGGCDSDDRDRDGLSDRLEQRLAVESMPAIHQFAEDGQVDRCPEPVPRPVLFRARPRRTESSVDLEHVVITYVLLYSRDCGALGHEGDAEPFSVFLARDGATARWQVISAQAVAHRGTPFEQVTSGSGRDIWVSRDKHANFAAFDGCGERDADVCSRSGPSAPVAAWLNVGEPGARLSDDLGDVAAVFAGREIWGGQRFGGAGTITENLFLTRSTETPPGVNWLPDER